MLVIPNILNEEEILGVTEFLEGAKFIDGKLTAGELIRHRKHNLQLHQDSEGINFLSQLMLEALKKNILFQSWVMPLRYSDFIFARYTEGMKYGCHVDSSYVISDQPMRRDISATLFLSDPDTYEGGELSIQGDTEMHKFKPAAGSLVVYPTQALHEVCEITSGTRLVSVFWAQSVIQDPLIRRTLFDLEVASSNLAAKSPDSPEVLLLQKSSANLKRYFASI
mgnify:CR=1 FL=1